MGRIAESLLQNEIFLPSLETLKFSKAPLRGEALCGMRPTQASLRDTCGNFCRLGTLAHMAKFGR